MAWITVAPPPNVGQNESDNEIASMASFKLIVTMNATTIITLVTKE